jgi:hypothetical protein
MFVPHALLRAFPSGTPAKLPAGPSSLRGRRQTGRYTPVGLPSGSLSVIRADPTARRSLADAQRIRPLPRRARR